MDDISPVSRLEFAPGRSQTAILPKDRKAGKVRKAKCKEAKASDDEFHLHAEAIEESAESLDTDHIDLDV